MGGAVNTCNDAPCGCRTDGTAQEAELADDEGDPGATDQPFAGDDRFIHPSLFACPGETSGVVIVDIAIVGWSVPGNKRALI